MKSIGKRMASTAQKLPENYWEASQNLRSALRKLSQHFLSSSTGLQVSSCQELERTDDFLYASRLALILVYTNNFRMTFKVHYHLHEAQAACSASLGGSLSDQVNEEFADDFMMEICNLCAGQIVSQLQHKGVSSGISLPIVTDGFDEAIFSDRSDSRTVCDYWSLDAEDNRFYFTLTIKSRSPKAMQTMIQVDDSTDQLEGEDFSL